MPRLPALPAPAALSFVADPDVLCRSAEEQGVDPEARARAEREGRGEWNDASLQIDSTQAPGGLRPLLRRIQAQQDRVDGLPPREARRVIVEGTIEAAAGSTPSTSSSRSTTTRSP